MSESQKCYASFSLFLHQSNNTLSVFLSSRGIRGHKAEYYPNVFNPNGVKMGQITMNFHFHNCCFKIYINLDSKRLGLLVKMFENQVYIDYSQKHLSNIETQRLQRFRDLLQCYNIKHARKTEMVIIITDSYLLKVDKNR